MTIYQLVYLNKIKFKTYTLSLHYLVSAVIIVSCDISWADPDRGGVSEPPWKITCCHMFPKKYSYQSPLILTELVQLNLLNVSHLTACYLYQVIMTLHFLSDVANDAESTQKSKITS